MAYDRDDYWQEAFETAMEDAGCSELLAQMTDEQRAEIGGALCGSAECQSMAFHVPENPMIQQNKKLERKVKWERELDHCHPCDGSGRLEYNSGPWAVNAHCDHCNGRGKVHPLGEREPA